MFTSLWKVMAPIAHWRKAQTKALTLDTIDMSGAFSFIPSQDPDVLLRFYLPIPNWQDGVNHLTHRAIDLRSDGARFTFWNERDSRRQAVRVDGSGVIIIGNIRPDQAQALLRYVQAYSDPARLIPDDVVDILAHAKQRLGLDDFYHGSAKDVPMRMHPFNVAENGKLGAWLPQPHQSAAVYIPGQSSIRLLKGDPQSYSEGAYVTFPTIAPAELAQARATNTLAKLCADRKVTPRAVEAATFERQNTAPDGQAISAGVVQPKSCPPCSPGPRA